MKMSDKVCAVREPSPITIKQTGGIIFLRTRFIDV